MYAFLLTKYMGMQRLGPGRQSQGVPHAASTIHARAAKETNRWQCNQLKAGFEACTDTGVVWFMTGCILWLRSPAMVITPAICPSDCGDVHRDSFSSISYTLMQVMCKRCLCLCADVLQSSIMSTI